MKGQSSKGSSSIKFGCRMFSELMKGPKTSNELINIIGTHTAVERWIKAMKEEGILYIKSYRKSEGITGQWAKVYALQDLVGFMDDAAQPWKLKPPKKTRPRRVKVEVSNLPVFSLQSAWMNKEIVDAG